MLAGVVDGERAELYGRIGCKAYRTAILEFDLGAAAVVRFQLSSLCNREVQECILESHAGVFVDLDGALHVAEANDTGLRISQGGQREKGANRGQRKKQAESRYGRCGHNNPRSIPCIY